VLGVLRLGFVLTLRYARYSAMVSQLLAHETIHAAFSNERTRRQRVLDRENEVGRVLVNARHPTNRRGPAKGKLPVVRRRVIRERDRAIAPTFRELFYTTANTSYAYETHTGTELEMANRS
jgi:hypothetical protein